MVNKTAAPKLRENSYSKKLQNPRWKKRCEQILRRDNYTCTSCGDAPESPQVHHIRYIWSLDPWEYDDDDLTTLCDPCHERVTFTNRALKSTLDAILDENVDAVSAGVLLTGIQSQPAFISIDRAIFMMGHLLLNPRYARVCSVLLDKIRDLKDFDAQDYLDAHSVPTALRART